MLGGGYANTELRSLERGAKVFQYVDYITLDDGESPILKLLEHLDGKRAIDFPYNGLLYSKMEK